MANNSSVDKNNPLFINEENIKVEQELNINKIETLDDNVTIEDGRIKYEIPEENSSDSDSVVSEKHENDEQLYTINYENIKLENVLHTELIVGGEILEETVLEEKPFSCDICNKKYSHQSTLIQHKRIHKGEKPFVCDICDKRFDHQSNLTRHKMIHSGEKPFLCDICNKSFNRQNHLVEHKMIHSGEKPISCDICNKRFTRQSSLNRHKQIHSGEKPFACDICNKRFNRQSYLVQHKRNHN